MSRDDDFFAGFTTPQWRGVQVGDKVYIPMHQTSGTVVETGITLPWSDVCVRVERDDNSGEGIYAPEDVRRQP